MHKAESVKEIKTYKIPLDFEMKIDCLIVAIR